MKIVLNWQGRRGNEETWFPAAVPGNIQQDYAAFNGWGDIQYGENVKRFRELEDDDWFYQTEFDAPKLSGEKLYFVAKGIDYYSEIRLNGELLCSHEGMFEAVELDLTDRLAPVGNRLEVHILPHPLRDGYPRGFGRDEASASCKPAVCYGWIWHPRLLSSGLWDEAYLETRGAGFIRGCSFSYTLNEARDTAKLRFSIDADKPSVIRIWNPDGKSVYEGADCNFELTDIRLWWCAGQGEQPLYRWSVSTDDDERTGRIGFRTLALVMNEGSWAEPTQYPMTRSEPPITLCLNGRNVLAKGSNFVRPELFPGNVDESVLRPLIEYAREANLNFLRVWGGSELNRDCFFDFCDELGIMVWQEFPLACNNYPDDPHYLEILRQEARAMIRKVRLHPSRMLWCGGNELFNRWSGMTDQSLALRLLNSLCLELDPQTPYLCTAPVMGMAHGCYSFHDNYTGRDVFELFQSCKNTAYTEFGIPSMPDADVIRSVIPPDEVYPIEAGGSWDLHYGHGVGRGYKDAYQLFEGIDSIEALVKATQLMQCEGLKAVFEEARRQWPHCSMVANWCFNEPWVATSNETLLCYPHKPKPGFYAVRDALRPVLPSARIPKFDWKENELFTAELWLLNDSPETVEDTVTVYLEMNGESVEVLRWVTGEVEANRNKQGHRIQWILPKIEGEIFKLRLCSAHGDSEYTLVSKNDKPKQTVFAPKKLNA